MLPVNVVVVVVVVFVFIYYCNSTTQGDVDISIGNGGLDSSLEGRPWKWRICLLQFIINRHVSSESQ